MFIKVPRFFFDAAPAKKKLSKKKTG